jgi:diguanylate cyclase (GGDEF)-like protein/PAS domain S-box-containing protein
MTKSDKDKERLELVIEVAGLDLWENDLLTGDVPRKAVKTFAELGYSEAEAASYVNDLFALIHPDDVSAVKAAIQSHLEGVTAQYRSEFRILAKNGSWVWYANYGRVVDAYEGNSGRRFIGVTFNIDDRKRKEFEYAQREQDLHDQEKFSQSLLRLSKGLEGSNSYSAILNVALEEVRSTLGYQSLWVYLLTKDNKYLKALIAGGEDADIIMSEDGTANLDGTALLKIDGDRMLEEIVEAKDIVIVEDARNDERCNKKFVEISGVRTILNIPIILFDKNLGCFGTGSFGQEGVRVPPIRAQKYLMAIASHLAVSIDRMYLLSERKKNEEILRVTASVFEFSHEGIAITDALNNFIDVNPAFTRITGYDKHEVIAKKPKLLQSGLHDRHFFEMLWKSLAENDAWRGEIWNRRKSGETYPAMLSISLLRDSVGKAIRHVAVFSDISDRKKHEAELIRIAHFDALTSIPNRILLFDRMKQAIFQTSRDKSMMAVCYLDLDGFKPINDAMGHQTGDQILIEVAKRIGATIRGGDTVARLGGDEFVVLLLGLAKGKECISTLERLLSAIVEPIAVGGKTVAISASIGVSIYPNDDEDPDTLLRHADQSMYIAKRSGKNRFHIYDVEVDKRARDHNDSLKAIRNALELQQFELHYQPKVDLRTKKMVGVEGLIRWRHPERGLLHPADFLRLVENTAMDIAIGEWVIANALAQIQHLRSIGLDLEVSVNISGYHLESDGFVEKLRQQLAQYPGLPSGKFQIEILETVALEDVSATQRIIESCSEAGVGFALDDFGTGYSSLSYLSTLPVNVLKIDRQFIRDMLEDKGDMAIVQGIIGLAKAFERQTVAEGIETDAHYQVLLEMGCEIGQGYGIARPMPAADLATWNESYR